MNQDDTVSQDSAHTVSAVTSAEQAVSEARKALSLVDAACREEIREAVAEVQRRHEDAMTAARSSMATAEAALRAAKDTLPDHPWTGKKVYRLEAHGRVWDRRPGKRIEGVIETRRSATVFPGNTSTYSLPEIGHGFVRLLKSDGTPGARFEALGRGFRSWNLAEETTPPADHSASVAAS